MLKRRLIIKNQTTFLVKLKKRTITALLEYQIPLTVTSSFIHLLHLKWGYPFQIFVLRSNTIHNNGWHPLK